MSHFNNRKDGTLLRTAVVAALGLSATTVSAVEIQATASTTVGGGETFLDGPASSGDVDVLDFDSDGSASHGIHTFGDVGGNFGSRSSGNGPNFYVDGQFTYQDTITATGAENYILDFELIPGELSVSLFDDFGGGFLSAGFQYDITVNGISVFSSTYTIENQDNTLTHIQTGTDIMGTISPDSTSYSYNTFAGMVDLGMFGAGESFEIALSLYTFAEGVNTFSCGFEGGEGDVGRGVEGGEGGSCGSIARFGDPLAGPGSNTFAISSNPVAASEPPTVAILASGMLAVLGAMRRRRQG